MPKLIAILALEGVQLLDVAGPLDVFAQANVEAKREVYTLRVVGYRKGPIQSSSGARLMPDWVMSEPAEQPVNTLLIAGSPHASQVLLNKGALQWIRSTSASARRYGSVCTGAFILAAAGLLEGRRVTTHWNSAHELQQAYPGVIVEEDSLHVRDGKLRTSAGVTAGLDLALSLVEEDLGRDIAAKVASELVMYFKRPGGQLQFSRKGETGPAGRSVLQEVQRWAAAHPELPLTVETMAEHAGLSARHFARLFHAEVGVTPAAWVEMTRVASARGLLQSGRLTPKQVAAQCGFGNVDTFRRAFTRHVGVSPAEYRRFNGVSAP